MHLADAFIQNDLQCFQVVHFIVSTCVPWDTYTEMKLWQHITIIYIQLLILVNLYSS